MRTFEFDSLDTAYSQIIKAILEEGIEVSPRGMLTRELSPVAITITNPRNRVISHPKRKLNYGFMVGEALWYLSGTDDLKQVAHYNSQWKKFSDDGITLNGAYGKRLFDYSDITNSSTQDGFVQNYNIETINQFEAVIEKFKKDKDSRHGTLLIFRPSDLIKETKDVPCNNLLRVSIRNNKLQLINVVRSNDVIFGLPYDAHFFMLFQELLAARLGVELGNYVHVVDSLHLYEMHFEMAKELVEYGPTNIYRNITPHNFGLETKVQYDSTIKSILELEELSRNDKLDILTLNSYVSCLSVEGWKNYARIIASYNFKKHKKFNESNEILEQITGEFKNLCNWKIEGK